MSSLIDTYAQLPMAIAAGEGSRVRDEEGKEYWDLYGGHAVAILGHSHPGVAEALAAQARTLAFYSNVARLRVRERAAERLCAFAPEGLDRAFFCNSGTEANENALKLAVQQTGRHAIVALKGAFHGRTLLSLSATASEKLRAPFGRMLTPCTHIGPNAADELGAIDESTAAVIVEPIQSMAGVVELSGTYLRAVRRRCDETGAKLIYDEVQTGMGRLGRPFAAGEHGVMPDMVTTAKAMANGFPMGAVLAGAGVADRVRIGDLGTTFGGGPLACAALLAVLTAIEEEGLVDNAARLGRVMREKLYRGPVREVVGRGCLIGLRVMGEAKALHGKLLERGFITGTSGDPAVLRLLPPINLPVEAIDQLAAALSEIGA